MFTKQTIHESNNEYSIDTIDSIEHIETIKEDWNRLYEQKEKCPIFFSYQIFKIYYEIITKHFPEIQIKIIIIRKKSRIIAILPLTLEIQKILRLFSIKVLLLKEPNRIGFYNFLFDSNEKKEQIIQALIAYLTQQIKSWDIIRFDYIPENEENFDRIKNIFSKYYKTRISTSETVVLPCKNTLEDEIKKEIMNPKMNNIHKKTKKLEKIGEVKFLSITDQNEIIQAMNDFIEVEDKNWKGRNNTSLKRTYQHEFYKKIAEQLSQNNNIMINFLKVKDTNISGHILIMDKDTCYYIKSGYDEAYAKYSPSYILDYLQFNMFLDLTKIDKIDFYGPLYPYQKRFGRTTRKRYTFYIYNNTFLMRFLLTMKKLFQKQGT